MFFFLFWVNFDLYNLINQSCANALISKQSIIIIFLIHPKCNTGETHS